MKLTRAGVVDPVVRWFDLRGCNSLLRGTGKYRNTSVRAFPALMALFLLVMLVLVPLATPAGIVLGLVISVVVLIAAWLLGRLVRRGEPLTAMGRVRWTEVVAFIVGPMIAVAIPSYDTADAGDLFGGVGLKPLAVLAAGALQIILISAVLLVTGLGLGSLSRWLLTEFLQSIRLTGTALAASLPVILGVVFFFFMNPGVWLIIGRLPAIAYTAVILLLLLLTGAFLGSRSQFDLRTLSTFDNTEDLRAALTETPMQDADVPAIDQPERTPPSVAGSASTCDCSPSCPSCSSRSSSRSPSSASSSCWATSPSTPRRSRAGRSKIRG